MIDVWEEMFDVALENIRIFFAESLGAVDGGVRAFAHPARIRVEDKAAVEERLYYAAQGMMNHAVTKGRSGDQARLGIIYGKVVIPAGGVSFILQLTLKREKVFLQVVFKAGNIRPAALAAPRGFEGKVQVFERGDLWVQMFICFHVLLWHVGNPENFCTFTPGGNVVSPKPPSQEHSCQNPATRDQEAGICPPLRFGGIRAGGN